MRHRSARALAVLRARFRVSPAALRGRLVVSLTVGAIVSLGALGASPAALASTGAIAGTVTDA